MVGGVLTRLSPPDRLFELALVHRRASADALVLGLLIQLVAGATTLSAMRAQAAAHVTTRCRRSTYGSTPSPLRRGLVPC